MGKKKNKKQHSYTATEEKKAKKVLTTIGVLALVFMFLVFILFSSF